MASFLQTLSYKEPYDFEAILRIFMGVLIEEFISTIAGVGNLGQIKTLVMFYDTGVLMRTLGCSGGLLRVATVEMTEYLQDISVGKVSYFSGNEEEALGILQTIIERKQAGGEVFRETAEAMANGEIDIPRLKAIEGMLTQPLNPSICSVMNFGSESDRLRF